MITVMGLGFVGLTTALGFCEKGYRVYGYDIDSLRTDLLKNGKVPYYEPMLNEKLEQHLKNGRFQITDDLESSVRDSRLVFICVGTPSGDDGEADLKYIFAAIEAVISSRNPDQFVALVVKSTVPPSTTRDQIRSFVERLGFTVGKDIGLAANPEFLREGFAWEDFIHPDRIVIGEEDARSGDILEEVYTPFGAAIHRVSSETAEYIKYLSNTLLATLISFANEQSLIAKRIGDIDIQTAFSVLHQDKRWFGHPAKMSTYAYPGCGFGGYCLPKDTQALVALMRKHSYEPSLLASVLEINKLVKDRIVDEIASAAKPEDAIGILGLSFKPDSDDVRDTPAKGIIERLLMRGYTNITAYDPMATANFRKQYSFKISYADRLEDCVSSCSHLVLLTAWEPFRKQKAMLQQKKVWDYRYVL
ncbi:UDP-glucose/GDP-mannose dehydrogenase family protein [Paenibacillus sp.]|uniref:UDP-glucose dehydrogenase family protein n=1 Tax=Paenibacillus sp. TaxID=58172 RepID=UPI002D24F759|nr:UDP-glucose/GDP-mannose dehydrogenase family protein [Paenibacillus sp.]HZG87972.1 UDP-glucose/GDP-mannose dehydrogenase family protein [Paenibacillus sp.]